MKKILGGDVGGKSTGNIAGNAPWRDVAMTTPLLSRIAATVKDARTRGPERLGITERELAVFEALGGAEDHLRALIGRAVRAGTAPGDAESLVLASALEAIAAGEARDAVTLGASTWRRCRRELRRARQFARHHLVADVPETGVPAEGGPESLGVLLVASALRSGVIGPRDAALIVSTRLEGRALVDLAAEWAVPVRTLASARRRAEARLAKSLADEEDA